MLEKNQKKEKAASPAQDKDQVVYQVFNLNENESSIHSEYGANDQVNQMDEGDYDHYKKIYTQEKSKKQQKQDHDEYENLKQEYLQSKDKKKVKQDAYEYEKTKKDYLDKKMSKQTNEQYENDKLAYIQRK